MINNSFIILFICLLFILSGCNKSSNEVVLKSFNLDTLDGLIFKDGVQPDKNVTSDGNGSLKIDSTNSTVVKLFETGDIDIEDAKIVYQAMVKSEGLDSDAYLEMFAVFNDKGEFFSRGLASKISGNSDWKKLETPFYSQRR